MTDSHKAHAHRHLRARFQAHLFTNAAMAAAILLASLGAGMLGYRHYAHMGWLDAFLNSAMLLSGMGPAETVHDDAKLFAGLYAIYCGLALVAIVGLVLTPVGAYVLRKFHLDQQA